MPALPFEGTLYSSTGCEGMTSSEEPIVPELESKKESLDLWQQRYPKMAMLIMMKELIFGKGEKDV